MHCTARTTFWNRVTRSKNQICNIKKQKLLHSRTRSATYLQNQILLMLESDLQHSRNCWTKVQHRSVSSGTLPKRGPKWSLWRGTSVGVTYRLSRESVCFDVYLCLYLRLLFEMFSSEVTVTTSGGTQRSRPPSWLNSAERTASWLQTTDHQRLKFSTKSSRSHLMQPLKVGQTDADTAGRKKVTFTQTLECFLFC